MNANLQSLIAAACVAVSTSQEQLLETIITPRWHDRKGPNNWRVYVPGELRALWDSLPIEARIVGFAIAENQANWERVD